MRHYEEWLAFLSTHLPSPVRHEELPDGSILLTGGDPGQVVARLTRSAITIYEYAVIADAAGTMTIAPRRVGLLVWRRARNNEMVRTADALIDAARESRLSKFTVCLICERSTPPEQMHDDQICDACARLEASRSRR